MEQFYFILGLLCVAGASNPPPAPANASCTRNVVYNVGTLQQTSNCCQNMSLNNGGGLEDVKAQVAALQQKLQVLQNKLEKQASGCVEKALITGLVPVRDNQLSVSSVASSRHAASRSRLHTRVEGSLVGAWCAGSNTNTQCIQVSFGRSVAVKAIATQGRNNVAQWITFYTLSVSNDGSIWRAYTEDGVLKVFGGNWDSNTVNKYHLATPVTARFLRLHPKSWHNHISLRWEVYGCTK